MHRRGWIWYGVRNLTRAQVLARGLAAVGRDLLMCRGKFWAIGCIGWMRVWNGGRSESQLLLGHSICCIAAYAAPEIREFAANPYA
jgi:hypothetical protein